MKTLLLYASLFFLLMLGLPSPSQGSPVETGRILFMIGQGEHESAVKLYQQLFEATQVHDFDLLHQMGLAILDYGSRQKDPETQLLSLYGASVAAHEEVYYILENSLSSKIPAIQLIALQTLAQTHTTQADQAILRMLGSPSLQIRYEAVHQLCKKKHPLAVSQAESLMYKIPKEFWPLFPPLFAMVGDSHSTRILRRLFNQTSKDVQLSILLSAVKYERDDLLPQIRQLTVQHHFAQQEACAFALGQLKDDQSLPKLEKLSQSQYPTVALAARLALYRLGRPEAGKRIETMAQSGDLYAIAALGEIENSSSVLINLLENQDIQIRTNAAIALLDQRHPSALQPIAALILRDHQDWGYTAQQSPGTTLSYWKATSSASQLFKDDFSAYADNLKLKESLLEKLRQQSEEGYIALAHQILTKQQNELVPAAIHYLEDLGTDSAIACLKEHQQQLGAPLVRMHCNLALYQLKEPGPYGELLRTWVKNQIKTQFIRFEPFDPWNLTKGIHSLTPEETSKFLLDSFLAFTTNQDPLGIEALIEAIGMGHAKNKYALAGLLLRATQ